MKIKILYNKDYKSLKVPAILITPHKRISSEFIIDTGSPHTLLNYTDSLRLSIPHSQKAEIVRIAGRAYQSYIFNRLTIVFKSSEGKEIKETIPVRVIKPMSMKSDELENLDRLPNLLGMDFLEKNYKLLCNIEREDIHLEKIN
jgi:hypothetical protein